MVYQPIENYGIIGDTHSVALVRMNGSIDWLCFPHFDSPSVFAAIIDDRKGGRFKISPAPNGRYLRFSRAGQPATGHDRADVQKDLVRLVLHFTTRKVRCVTPAPSITRVLSSSIGSVPRWSNNRTPSPSRMGTKSTCISSRSPALMHCCTMLAPTTPTSLSPATALACSRALSRPPVTNVNGDPS